MQNSLPMKERNSTVLNENNLSFLQHSERKRHLGTKVTSPL